MRTYFDYRAMDVCNKLREAGGVPTIVGGYVRDQIMGVDSKDIDIEVFGLSSEQVEYALARIAMINKVGSRFGVFQLMVAGLDIQVSLPRRESKSGAGHKGFIVEPDPALTRMEAAARRDFTINSMSLDPFTGEIFDYWHGIEDLQTGTLRHTSSHFAEDPLRVLRGMQFAGRFNMRMAGLTVCLCESLKGEYATLPKEAIWTEWVKWASKSVRPSRGLSVLLRTMWIELYPELFAMAGCMQDEVNHPEGDVIIHTGYAVDKAAEIAIREKLTSEDRATLVFAALLHDVGKPGTTKLENKKITTHGHDTAGISISLDFLKSIGAPWTAEGPGEMAQKVSRMVGGHMRHLNINNGSMHRVVRHIAEDIAPASIEMLAWLMEADTSARPPLPAGMGPKAMRMLEVARDLKVEDKPAPSILMGRHLIDLGVTPGPAMGHLLRTARAAQLDGEFVDLDGAFAYIRPHIDNFGS